MAHGGHESLGRESRWSGLALVVAVVGVAALLAHVALFYRAFFFDDSFITLRYCQRFLDGRGLTFNDGERVEGYSNFLWLLLVAAGGVVTQANLVDVARALGVLCAAAGMFAVVAAAPPRHVREAPRTLLVLLLLAASGPVASWSVGGLEAPLLAGFVAWGAVLAYRLLDAEHPGWRGVLAPASCFALAALTRPDGILFTVGATVGIVLARSSRRARLRTAARLAIVPGAAFLAHLLFRRAYYGDWVPNTYYAKVAITGERILSGLRYVFAPPAPVWFYALAPLAVVAAVRDARRKPRLVFLSALALLWSGYVVTLGGDIAPERRHLVPLFYLLALLDLEGIDWLAARATSGASVAAVAPAAALAGAVALQWNDLDRALSKLGNRDSGESLGRFLSRAFATQRPLLAVDAAGAVPFYSALPTLDMLGLSDRYLATHRPADFGSGWLAHELGDGAYFLRRKPDLVLFHEPPGQAGPIWRGGKEMVSSPSFRRFYKVVRFDTRAPDGKKAILWARFEDGRIGIERRPDGVTVPGFLLSTEAGPAATLDAERKLGLLLRDRESTVFSLRLEAGEYRLDVDARGPIAVTARTSTAPATTPAMPPIDVRVDSRVDVVTLVLAADGARATIRELRFARSE